MRRHHLRPAGVTAAAALALATLAGFAPVPTAPTDDPRADRLAAGEGVPDRLSDLRLDNPLRATDVGPVLDKSLVGPDADGKVIVRLRPPSVAEQDLDARASAAAKQRLVREQGSLIQRVRALDPAARVIGQTQVVLNAVFVEVDPSVLPQLAQDPAVERIAPVGSYQLDLSTTVPYVGAGAVQDAGVTGDGIKVAVLDSGIDYTHAALGGSGDVADYDGNDPAVIEPGTFPTAKVVGGHDFVGSLWPNASEVPDPDPLDDGPAAGHGTHVAHIIAGEGGVAPDADLYAVKVCSSVSSSCSGLSLILGMEFAVDPNGDGRLDDRVNIVNMSLGTDYGQPFDDDLSAAVDNATAAGVLTVGSAGNGGNKPYVNGTPAAAPTALSVAQTAMADDVLPQMQIGARTFPAVWQPWSAPLTETVSGPIQYADGAGGNLNGCAPFAPGSLTGKVVLVNRGDCNFTLKALHVQQGGGLVAVIGLITTEDPFTGADGGDGPITIPSFMVSLATANAMRASIGQVATFDPASGVPLGGSVVGSSSRGPQHEDTHLVKPEIGAPGASISAIAGTGTGEGSFGGTSGAAPVVSGVAALALESSGGVRTTPNGKPGGRSVGHGLTPLEVKALLMNNAETDILENVLTGELAPITRIGGGEVRADRAVSAPVVAWDADVPSSALSFGFVDVTDTVTLTKTVEIRNLDNKARTYSVSPTFRFADDQENGAVTITAPATVQVKPGQGRTTTFDVTLRIDGSKLRGNAMSSGIDGANPSTLTLNEYDGYLVLTDGTHELNMPWHVLPRKAAEVEAAPATLSGGGEQVSLTNTGVGTAQIDAFALVATSPDLPQGTKGAQAPTPDLRAVGVNTFGSGSCDAGFIWAFAVNTWERQQHLLPVSHQVWLDTDMDGVDDYVILNRDASGLGTISDGRQLTWSLDLRTGAADAFFFAEHATSTGNTVLYVCGEQVGLDLGDLLSTHVGMDVIAQDFFNGGPGDIVEDIVVTPLGERFVGVAGDVAGNSSGALTVQDWGQFPGNTDELGLMVLTNGDRGTGNHGGATQATEAVLLELE